MNRRDVIVGAGAIALAAPAWAQKPPARVGFIVAGDPEPSWSLFRKAMTALGYAEGRTVDYVYRASGSMDERAVAMVAAKVDVIVAVLTPAITAARQATSTIPIIFTGSGPGAGLIQNIARPEGNITGVFGLGGSIVGKNIQLFRDIKPGLRTVAILLNEPDPFHVVMRREAESAAGDQKVDVLPVLSNRADLPAAFERMIQAKADAVVVQPSLPMAEAAALALKHRLPSSSSRREFAETGGLMSYGSDLAELSRLLAGYADKILKGMAIADLPVQMPTSYQLIVNQKTAKAIGVALTPMFLGQAEEVIE